MRMFAIIVIASSIAVCTRGIEDGNQTKPFETADIKNSTDEEHSETLLVPRYVLADSGVLLEETPKSVNPETPIYSSVYAVKLSSPHYATDYVDNSVDQEYNNILGLTRNIPGIPGTDYPLYSAVPYTGFTCHEIGPPGFYADVAAGCQVWHYCQQDGRHDAFLCPNGTIFDQKNRVCNWWYNVHCQDSQYWYAINDDLYRIPKKNHVPDQYYDYYYLASKVVETKTKPPGTPKESTDPSIKMHPAVIFKIPKQPYRYTKDNSNYQKGEGPSQTLSSKDKFVKALI